MEGTDDGVDEKLHRDGQLLQIALHGLLRGRRVLDLAVVMTIREEPATTTRRGEDAPRSYRDEATRG